MNSTTLKSAFARTRLLLLAMIALVSFAPRAYAAAPGITGPSFQLTASEAYITEPDGQAIYSWGFGCNGVPSGFAPNGIKGNCTNMQVPGPTLIVNEGDVVTVVLTNNLPASTGNTSILFPGFSVTPSGGAPGLLTQEAVPGGSVTYKFTASSPGRAPTTAAHRAICRSRWDCMAQSLFSQARRSKLLATP